MGNFNFTFTGTQNIVSLKHKNMNNHKGSPYCFQLAAPEAAKTKLYSLLRLFPCNRPNLSFWFHFCEAQNNLHRPLKKEGKQKKT